MPEEERKCPKCGCPLEEGETEKCPCCKKALPKGEEKTEESSSCSCCG